LPSGWCRPLARRGGRRDACPWGLGVAHRMIPDRVAHAGRNCQAIVIDDIGEVLACSFVSRGNRPRDFAGVESQEEYGGVSSGRTVCSRRSGWQTEIRRHGRAVGATVGQYILSDRTLHRGVAADSTVSYQDRERRVRHSLLETDRLWPSP
jgi:hypothetical protein